MVIRSSAMDTTKKSLTETKLPSRKYVLPRSRYLETTRSATSRVGSVERTAAPRQTTQPVVITGRRRTEMLPPPVKPRSVTSHASSSNFSSLSDHGNRQSSPKCDTKSSADIQLIINDSVASAVLPHSVQMTSLRRRSLSAGESQTLVTVEKGDRLLDCARATGIAQVVLYRRFLALLNSQTEHYLQKLNNLLCEIQQERENLIAQLELEHWLKMYRLLCIENEALQSIEETLCSPVGTSEEPPEHQQEHQETNETTLLDRMTKLTTHCLAPVMNRLPLCEIQLPTVDSRVDFAADVKQTVTTAKLFSTVSNRELEKLEELANSAEQLLEEARTSTVPQVEARQQQLDRAMRLFAHEASLRMERMQRDWLSDFENI